MDRDAILAKLRILRGQRMDCDPNDKRRGHLTQLIDELLEQLVEASRV